ncbi:MULTISPECIES: GNAT family N-acetyltransferase [unclassified Enterococcus]|uniref:GNAT family N-acetyltransferase n=1 Tax=unclassified Enterococcus TaxID=2608891 RepID=UPI001A9BEDDC|nr:GNAT family N-acetyltransferase [Enterococcus sp. DIV1271a]MBO1299624.1 GNAT family N-acetyltransferase [Enterococcus sp. DIV1271a]
MNTYKWIRLSEHPELLKETARWFSSKWGIPVAVYEESIHAGIVKKDSIPQWYVVLDENEAIVGGAGVIENDFHDRPDLAPNLCALYVEPEKRKQRLAKWILEQSRKEMYRLGFKKLYLITDHTSFYERYDWSFLTTVKEEGGTSTRLYQSDTIG